MTTTGAPTRERILDAAQRLVLARGFAATTIDAVIGAAEVSKGSFFHHFPSKRELGRALVQRYARADAEFLDDHLATAETVTDDPAGQVLVVLRALEHAAAGLWEVQPGCLFVSFIYESELNDADTDALVAQAILHWRHRLRDRFQRAAEARATPPPVDLTSLADHVFTTIEGAYLLARALDDPDSLRRQLGHVRHYVAALFDLPPDGPDRPVSPTSRAQPAAA